MTTATSVDRADRRSVAAVDYDRWFDRPWGSYAFTVESAAVARATGAIGNRLVLDAGCGTGRFTARLADLHGIPVGVDIDPGMLSVARTRLPGRCLRAGIEQLPFANGVFDLAVAVTVLEFVADPAAAVAELDRVTRPGGRIVIGALNPHSPWGFANRHRLRSGAWCDARFLSRHSLRDLGQPHGRTSVHAALYAPGALPAPQIVGPVLEALGRLTPRWGGFQVLTIIKDGAT